MPSDSATTALARRIEPSAFGLPAAPVTEAALVSACFAKAKAEGCNLVGAETTISYIPPGYSVVFRLVRFDPEAPKTWYRTDDGNALSFVALSQLAELAGITWDYCRPLPAPRGSRFVWLAEAQGRRRLIDGTERVLSDYAELDLSGTAAESGCRSDAQLLKKRQKGAAHCASSAKARVIRQLLGIRTYSPEEQKKPFVVVSLAWIPPVGNPEVDKMIAAKELGIVAQVYGRAPARALPAPSEVFEEEDEGAEYEPEPVPAQSERQSETRREAQREEPPPAGDPWDEPQSTATEKSAHHPTWRADQARFFVELGKLADAWRVPEVKDYKHVTEFCAAIKRPRPSAMSQEQRVGLVGWLGQKSGRDAFERWLHTGEASAK